MTDDVSKRRLGRGLAALIGEIDLPQEQAGPVAPADGKVPIEHVMRNPRNPRRLFAEADLADLAQSIGEHGVVQPVVVRPSAAKSGHYEIIAGERRWRAAQLAGLADIPAVVRDVPDEVSVAMALIEDGNKLMGKTLFVPMQDETIEVEVTGTVFYDEKGERLHG